MIIGPPPPNPGFSHTGIPPNCPGSKTDFTYKKFCFSKSPVLHVSRYNFQSLDNMIIDFRCFAAAVQLRAGRSVKWTILSIYLGNSAHRHNEQSANRVIGYTEKT